MSKTEHISLWRNSSFRKLWAGQTISVVGSQVTALAMPLVAATQLNASPFQMGILQMATYLPFLLFGLLAGVWVDRLPRRPVLILTDIGRAVALLLVPLAAWGGWLHIETLYLVTFAIGCFNLLFEAAYAAILPVLVVPQQLATGNSRLQSSAAASEVVGPALAGWLIQIASAAFALVFNVLTFVGSAIFLLLMRADEAPHLRQRERAPILKELRVGLQAVLANDYIRPLTLCSCSANIFINMHLAIYVLYLTREMQLSPAQIGLLYTCASVGGLAGATLAARIARWIGLGRSIIAESVAVGLVMIALPFASMGGAAMLPAMAVLHALWGFWVPIYVVNAASLRQVITPSTMLGRVTASSRFISWGAAAIGFVIGGALAERIGLLPTLILAGIGLLISALWVICSKIRTLQAMPEPSEHTGLAAISIPA